jgi:hypothetical protein
MPRAVARCERCSHGSGHEQGNAAPINAVAEFAKASSVGNHSIAIAQTRRSARTQLVRVGAGCLSQLALGVQSRIQGPERRRHHSYRWRGGKSPSQSYLARQRQTDQRPVFSV